ncbi:N-acetyltransferase family protein [Pseudonocardia sp. CA-107938]|uniref:GNAT family N-acetyltransferase n=1 Tax=Pseudonocardia sp. CA-107938 TaxID=3240021 RepID=UPI003D924BC8
MQIRPAAIGDVEAIRSIGLRTWPVTYTSFAGAEYVADGLAKFWTAESVLAIVEDTRVVVAQDDSGAVVGMGNIDLRLETPVIWRLYVLPEQHGTGVGAGLMSTLLDLPPATTTAVRLEYMDGNTRAERFYRKQGFAEIGREPAERPGWPGRVWMERRLDGRAGGSAVPTQV